MILFFASAKLPCSLMGFKTVLKRLQAHQSRFTRSALISCARLKQSSRNRSNQQDEKHKLSTTGFDSDATKTVYVVEKQKSKSHMSP